MNETQQALDILRQLESVKDDDPKRFTSSNGITFRIKSVPPMLMRDASARLKPPSPPKVYIADKETHEENPDDPAYRRAMREYELAASEVANSIMLTRGTEVESLPPNIEPVEGAEWAEDVLEFAGITVPSGGRRRYYCWVKYVALTSNEDYIGLLRKVMRAGGVTVTEEDVAEAADSFRRNEEGPASEGVHTPEENGRGDTDNIESAWAGA